MSGYRVMVLTVLLAFCGSDLSGQEPLTKSSPEQGSGAATSAEEPPSDMSSNGAPVQEAHDWPDCDAGGIYRPFSWVRQLKLATAFFVDPTLLETAQIGHAYSLEQAHKLLGDDDLIKLISSDETLLAAPVATDDGTPALSPCRSLSHGEPYDGVPRFGSVKPSRTIEWIKTLSAKDRERFHLLLLGTEPLSDTDDSRFVTWDPSEGVGVSQRPEGGRP